MVVFTQGAKETVVAHDGKVRVYNVTPVPKELVVDTNGNRISLDTVCDSCISSSCDYVGAGDSFVGGFISQIVQGRSIEQGIRAGHYLSREVVQRSGCSFPSTSNFD